MISSFTANAVGVGLLFGLYWPNNILSSTNTAYPYLSSPMMLLTSATDSNTLAELCTEEIDFASQWALELESLARDITQA